MLKRIVAAVAVVMVPGVLHAQGGNQAVIEVQPGRYSDIQPTCQAFQGGHFRAKSGATYLKSALESPENRERLLNDAKRVLVQAITSDNQASSPMAWYWLGRVYLYQGDVVGADSALDRAQSLAPNCAEDLRKARLPTYGALLRPANAMMEAGKNDSAMIVLSQAAQFFPESPYAFQNLGILYFNKKQFDSAAANFSKAVELSEARMATDTTVAQVWNQAIFNLAAAYQASGKNEPAIEALRKYLERNPNDADAKRALAGAYRAVGNADSAQVIENQLLASGQSAGTGARNAEIDAFNAGLKAYQENNFKEAERILHQVLSDNPYFYNAVFTLAQTYLQLYNSDSTSPARTRNVAADSLIAVGERLMSIAPLNENSIILVARGYQIKRNPDQTLKYINLQRALPVNIEIAEFQVTGEAATINGTATGRAARDPQEKAIPPAPLTLVVEFLDNQGTVLASQEVSINALKEGETQTFTATAQAPGIAAWRYRKK